MVTFRWLLFFFLPPSLPYSRVSSFLSILSSLSPIHLMKRPLLFSSWHGIKGGEWIKSLWTVAYLPITAAVKRVSKVCIPRAAAAITHCWLMPGLQRGEVTGRGRGLGGGEEEQTVGWCYSYASQRPRDSPFGNINILMFQCGSGSIILEDMVDFRFGLIHQMSFKQPLV